MTVTEVVATVSRTSEIIERYINICIKTGKESWSLFAYYSLRVNWESEESSHGQPSFDDEVVKLIIYKGLWRLRELVDLYLALFIIIQIAD